MKIFKKNEGITLIALVITIIVMLILVGVTLNMINGENGILGKAERAVDEMDVGSGKEQAELLVTDYVATYYEERYVNGNQEVASQKTEDYVKSQVGTGKVTSSGDYFVTIGSDGKITVYNGTSADEGKKTAEGSFLEGGKVVWKETKDTSATGWTQDKITVTNGPVTLQVGQAVTGYTANSVGDGKWYVLGAKDGKLLITTNYNVTTVSLSGQDGYVNGITTLNTAAEAYTNTSFAEGKARTIDVDDINRVTGYDPDVAKYNSGNNVNQWKNEVTYTLKNSKVYYQGTKYPTSETSIGYSSFTYWTGSAWKSLASGENATLTNTYYNYYPQTLTSSSGSGVQIKDIANSERAYNLLFANTSGSDSKYYWLGSQDVSAGGGYVSFGMRIVGEGRVNGSALCSSSRLHDQS